MKVICTNASNKPKQISTDQWPIKGQTYTVVRVVRLSLQQDKLGLILKEISITDSFPYEFYDSARFSPVEELEKEEKALSEEQFSEVDLESLM